MNYLNFILAICIIFMGCNSSTTETNSDSAQTKITSQDTVLSLSKKDTVEGSRINNYWEQLPIRTVADLILKDSIRPISNPVIYKMLDSLSSDLKPTRQFYFGVFNKIMNKADGEVAESIGGYALTYVQNYPKEFLENSRTLSKNQFEAWASNIGIELYLSSSESDNVKETYDQMVVLFNDNCKDCIGYFRSRLKEFTNLIWQTIRENQQAQK